jgi:hypothetical protein
LILNIFVGLMIFYILCFSSSHFLVLLALFIVGEFSEEPINPLFLGGAVLITSYYLIPSMISHPLAIGVKIENQIVNFLNCYVMLWRINLSPILLEIQNQHSHTIRR